MTSTSRVVPILTVGDIDAERDRYSKVLGMKVVMDHGGITTLADGSGRNQISLLTKDQTALVNPTASIEVDDVDAAHAAAVEQGMEIVHDLRDEPWGVRRFFFRDSTGNIVNVLSHAAADG